MRLRHRFPIIAVILVLVLGLFAACSNHDAPVAPSNVPMVAWSAATAPYGLAFVSRTYDSENDETTFRYQLQGVTADDLGGTPVIHVFTTLTVELPPCAPPPSSVSPPDGANIYTNANGIYGVEWGVGYDENPDFYYSVTFPGDVANGFVRGLVTTGGTMYVQNLQGPCLDGYQINGTVFADGNGDGFQQGNELGIADVTVALDGVEFDQTFNTDADGNYTFIAPTGTYTVSVNATTADSDFNESLYQWWNNTSATSREVTVGPDAVDQDFGWEPDVEAITAALDAGDLPTDGKSYKWWRKEYLRALNGTEPVAYTADELIEFAHQIDALALLDEYDFTPGNELQEVYDILNNHAFGGDDDGSSIQLNKFNGRQEAFAFLVRELLTTELNHVSGRGLADTQLQLILLNWGETVLNNNAPTPPDALRFPNGPNNSSIGDGPQRAVTSPLEDGGTIFKKINGATGGGGTGN